MKLSCENARSLVASYLDGELSEEQAAPLRTHLFDCRDCRELVKQGKVLERWFAEARAGLEPVGAPAGFSAQVARRAIALAEEPGAADPELGLEDEARPAGATRSLLPFLLRAVALAAGVLFVFALALRKEALPDTNALEAQEELPWEVGDVAPVAGTRAAPALPPAVAGNVRESVREPAPELPRAVDERR